MSNILERWFPDEPGHIYAKLNQQDVEQFYASYQLWNTRQCIAALQAEIETLHQQISENAQHLRQVHPPAVALATLARLQANGVSNIDLLERMLERGEEWLDLTMQRLDYCEQLDFIHDNYTQWCEHALEGAYDWIDSMREADADTLSMPVVATPTDVDEAAAEATEELLLRKLASDEDEEEMLALETTFKRPAVLLAPSVPASEETQPGQPQETSLDEALPTIGEYIPTEETLLPVSTETDADADLSLVSGVEESKSGYVEFAPELETLPPSEVAVGTDSSSVSDEQEYVEFTPAAEVHPAVEADADSSLVTQARQAEGEQSLREYAAPAPTSEGHTTDDGTIKGQQEEPIVSVVDSAHNQAEVQVSTAKNWEQPAQKAKSHQQRSFWRRLLAIIWR